jgi:polysaccharide pyruvyl transferase WcaK-like protein
VELASQLIHEPILTTKDLIARMQICDIMVASRFHGVVLPLALQKPVLSIATYGRKIGDVMSQCGLAAYHLEASKADVGHLMRAFQALVQDRHAIAQNLAVLTPKLRSSVNKQYEEVFDRSIACSAIPRSQVNRAADSVGLFSAIPS